MRHIAIIPARAGSKSIPNKNLQKIKGRNLIQWAMDAAVESKVFSEIILTTDIPLLLEDPPAGGVRVVPRNPNYATDRATMVPVVRDVADTLALDRASHIWVLQPTSPFRKREDFLAILEILRDPKIKSVISVVEVASHHPSRMYTIGSDEALHKIDGNEKREPFKNRQELKPVYLRNGSYYVTRLDHFREAGTFYIPKCRPYVMPEERSVNIDGPVDLALARALA